MNEKSRNIQWLLKSSDIEMRIAASKQLSSLPEPPMELFVVCLADPDWRVRKSAVEAFFQNPPSGDFIPELIKLLHHSKNAGLRNAAIQILIGLGPRAVAELQREISEPNVEVRKFVIDILGEIGDSRCAPALLGCLADADINVLYAVVETLGKLRIEAAVQPLLELMAHPDPGLKFTILQSLSQIGGAISVERLFLYLDDRLLRKALYQCFAKVGGPTVVPPLVAGLNDPMRQVREAALCALGALWPEERCTIKASLATADVEQIAVFLEEIIAGDKPQLKEVALALYGTAGAGRDISPLLSCIGDEELRTPALAAFSELGEVPFGRLLNDLGAPDALPLLYLLFVGGELGYDQTLPLAIDAVHSRDPQLRNMAARALGNLGGKQQFDLLLLLLDDDLIEIQDTAIAAIAAFAARYQDIVLDRISSMLTCRSTDQRVRLVRILGLIDGGKTETQLLDAFKDSSVSIRCEAIRGLNGHVGEAVISGLTLALTDESSEVRRLAVSALGRCSQDAVLPALGLAAGDSDFRVRAAVMRALGDFTGGSVPDLVRQGLGDPVGLVVIAALESSVILLPAQAQELLENALTHPDAEVVKAAMNLLSCIVGKHWIDSFGAALLAHPHRDVRLHAARTLGQSRDPDAPGLLEARLTVETEDIVRQAIESVLSRLPHSDSQDH